MAYLEDESPDNHFKDTCSGDWPPNTVCPVILGAVGIVFLEGELLSAWKVFHEMFVFGMGVGAICAYPAAPFICNELPQLHPLPNVI